MNALIIEDESIARDNLINILSEVDSSIKIVGCTEGVMSSVRWLTENDAPDIIFMDLNLADGSAFEIFGRVNVESPVIFTTAYDEYALKAFSANAIDYLLKPIKVKNVKASLDKYRNMTGQMIKSYIGQITEFKPPVQYIDRMLVTSRNKLIPVDVASISFMYTIANETTIYLSDGTKYRYFKALDSIVQTLDPDDFFRANRQFVIAKDKIKNITIWSDSRLVVTMDVDAPEYIFVSKNKAADFRKWIIHK